MNRPLNTAVFLLLAVLSVARPAPLHAQHTVTLRNGDRLSGTLKRIDGTMWVFAYGGEDVSLPVAEVTGLASSAPIGVRLNDGTIDAVTIAPTQGGLVLTLSTGTRTVTPAQLAAVGSATDLDALVPPQIGLFSPIARFWVANVAFGFSDKSGNSRARGLSTTLDIERRTTKDRITIGFGLIRESSQSPDGNFATTVSKSYGTLRVDVFVNPRFFVFGATRQERDRFQDIALRSTYKIGLGFQAVANVNQFVGLEIQLIQGGLENGRMGLGSPDIPGLDAHREQMADANLVHISIAI